MDVCRKPRCAACPPISKTLKKTQPPIYDVFGPFPDETVLACIDRLFYFIGARRVQDFFHLPRPISEACSTASDCSFNTTPYSDDDRLNRPFSPVLTGKSRTGSGGICTGASSPVKVQKKCLCRKCRSSDTIATSTTGSSRSGCDSRPNTKHGSPSIRASNDIPEPSQRPLRRSYSLCSLGYRKLKQKLTFQMPRSKEYPPKWLWTRMQCFTDGVSVYQVCHNSKLYPEASQNGECSRPELIFVVLANGVIVPFESMETH